MTTPRRLRAVTFDYGQTLGELDTAYLARRVGERGTTVDPARLAEATPRAWAVYDLAKARGEVAFSAWAAFMRALLGGAGVRDHADGSSAETLSSLVDFLWSEQPRKNLWRRPISGMKELVVDLSSRGVPLGIVSNSEGKLLGLLEEMELARYFPVVADSGVLGFEKPDPRIFEHVAERLGVPTTETVHVGDAWVADIEGALAVGASAIWVTATPGARELPDGVVACGGAGEIRTALRRLGFPA